MNLLAQILGLIALIFIILSTQQNIKEKILKFQLVANVLYAFQYLLLSALSATCMSGISFFRSLIFHNDTENGKKTSFITLIFFIASIIILGLLTFDGYYSLIPVCITILVTYGLWQNNINVFRIISVIVSVCWIIYNFMVGAYTAIIGAIFELISSLIAIIRYSHKK